MRDLSVRDEVFPIAGSFVIARGSKTEAAVLTVAIAEGNHTGRGECVPYRRYGETSESVRDQIALAAPAIKGGAGRRDLLDLMPAGAARNAIDCALWDLEAKISGKRVLLGRNELQGLVTAYTLSLSEPDKMFEQAKQNAWRPLLKVKVGTSDDVARMRAVAAGAPDSRIILDANEGWTPQNVEANLALAAELNVALVEQPLKVGEDEVLGRIDHKVPICADESVHTERDLKALVGLYDAINIKLDKTGGLTAALILQTRARELGFKIMVGCMVGTSLAMAPAVLLAQDADFVDLDGPLLLARDREEALVYEGSLVLPPRAELWG
ncbi:MAG: N-acetyl-D-Glu racemase DgcA [Rhizobiaceae bacterium]